MEESSVEGLELLPMAHETVEAVDSQARLAIAMGRRVAGAKTA